jgi:hypothetical protein
MYAGDSSLRHPPCSTPRYRTSSSHFSIGFREKKMQTKHGMASEVFKKFISKIIPAIFSEYQVILPLLKVNECYSI